jgi:hypothetical protein
MRPLIKVRFQIVSVAESGQNVVAFSKAAEIERHAISSRTAEANFLTWLKKNKVVTKNKS